MYELKTISKEGVARALAKAERYRLLNEPRGAESICRDVLAVDPGNQEAIVSAALAITDQFGVNGRVSIASAQKMVAELRDDYQRAYYTGVVYERWAKAQLGEEIPGHVVLDWLREAMKWYDKAQALHKPGDDDAILRWNTCARIINENESYRPHHAAHAHDDFDDAPFL